jgi:hypothetical protein
MTMRPVSSAAWVVGFLSREGACARSQMKGSGKVRIDSLTRTVEPVACECTAGDPRGRSHGRGYPPSARRDMPAGPDFAQILQRAELNPAKVSSQIKGKI